MACCNQILEAAATVTPCECSSPGFCPRHRCDKSDPHLYRLCKTRPDYFALWEQGRGPCPVTGAPNGAVRRGLGDFVALAIHRLTFGLVAVCPSCSKRRQWLNRFGDRIVDWWHAPK